MNRILATARFGFRSDTLENWQSKNPELLAGEFGVVTGRKTPGDNLENKSQKVKIGDGIHHWNELEWWSGGISDGSGGTIEVDQIFDPTSSNPQSGKAVAEAIENCGGSGNGTTLPAHKNTPHKPQTKIVNNCQTSTTYKGSGLSVNTTDHILGSQCVRVSGKDAYIRFTTNTFDMKNNHLVVKIKVNSFTEDTCRILIKVGHTTNSSNYAWYTLSKKNSNSVFGEWEEYTVPYLSYSYATGDATALDFENINDVFVMLSEGTGNFDIQFIGLRQNPQSKGIISFTFDDSWKSQYTGIKTLAERGLTGTIYHIEGIPDSTTLSTEELKELVKYYGADIEVHGADFYNNMTTEEIVEVWKNTQQYLRENGISDGRHLAYPGGQYPKKATDEVMKYFDSARTIDGYIYQESFPPYNNYQLRAFSGVMDSNIAKVKQQIDRTVENKNWLILVFHKIESGSGDMYCTPEALAEIADYAINSGARIMNIAEVYETNGGGGGGSVNIEDVIDALPIYNGEVG